MGANPVSLITNLLGGNITDGVAKIISLFHVDPNVAAQNAEKLAEIQADMVNKQVEAANVAIQAASANIRAEMSSGDKYTVRARPSFLYLVELILGTNYILIPFYQLVTHQPLKPFDLPTPLLWLFGSGYLGYTGARSWDKFMGTPGDSVVELPLGIKASQKS